MEEKKREEQSLPEVYSEEHWKEVENHIKKYFGETSEVFHEIFSPDIHVDIYIIPPTKEKNYYTLVTMGMGAHRMNVPVELAEYKLERAELAICLPHDWNIGDRDEKWYWPLRLLKQLARLPITCNTWLGWGHSIDNQKSFAENTQLSGSMLIDPIGVMEGASVCALPEGEEVNFYQILPIYSEEMIYKQTHNAEALLNKMNGIPFVICPDRPNFGNKD